MMLNLSHGSLLQTWRQCLRLPGGKRLFSYLIGRLAPYSGSIGAVVDFLAPGHAKLFLRDRRPLRNHLKSIHAIALANLGELTSGLAVHAGLPNNTRGIITGLTMVYLKKARGPLSAECCCNIPPLEDKDIVLLVETTINDAQGDTVAKASVTWRLGRLH